MPTISSSLIPTVSPGALFSRLVTDTTLNIRWTTAQDPVFYESVNRPIADLAVRQLIIAKTLDALQLRLSHQNLFPFLVPCSVDVGTTEVDIPSSWIWDLHASLPKKWENIRLAKIKRLSGTNGTSPSGTLRLLFSGEQEDSNTEVYLFYADYTIDSDLSYQYVRLQAVTSSESETSYISASESSTVTGFIIFRYLDPDDTTDGNFIDQLTPPTGGTDLDSDGIYDNPSEFEVTDTVAGGASVTGDYSLSALNHGTGLLVASAFNSIPPLDSDINSWLTAFNYPFRVGASRTSTGPITVTIPQPLFSEFSLTVPVSDEPSNSALTADSSGLFSPVWISKIRRCDDTANKLQFFFSTYNIKIGSETTDPVEFAIMELERDFSAGQVVEIEPVDPYNLQLEEGSNRELFGQGFGRGHVVLSSLWGITSDTVDNFFDSFQTVLDDPADVLFAKSATILGAMALSRVPRYTPTLGQFQAMAGTTSERSTSLDPSDDNKFVTEQDQGLGDQVDFSSVSTISENDDIESIAYKGSLCHRLFYLVVDSSGENHTYSDDILPRIRHILGRDPRFGDVWFDGTRFKTFAPNGTWIG